MGRKFDAEVARITRLIFYSFKGYTAREVAEMRRQWAQALIQRGDRAMRLGQQASTIAKLNNNPALASAHKHLERQYRKLCRQHDQIKKILDDMPEFSHDYMKSQGGVIPDEERKRALQRLHDRLNVEKIKPAADTNTLTATFLAVARAERVQEIKVGDIVDDEGKPAGLPPAQERGIATPEFRNYLRNELIRELKHPRPDGLPSDAPEVLARDIETDLENLAGASEFPRWTDEERRLAGLYLREGAAGRELELGELILGNPGLTLEEVSRDMGVAPETARVLFHRLTKRLADRSKRSGSVS